METRPSSPRCSGTATDSAMMEPGSALLQMVQRGQAPAGVRCPNASPTNDSPTASRLPRPPKPWESVLPPSLCRITAPA
uniref:Peroxisomal membrane protein PEX14-like KPWE domain-containing protein n=1 Tax=Phasianus colchicus TaxID=9054 RepID=A0A669P7B4_PHACC